MHRVGWGNTEPGGRPPQQGVPGGQNGSFPPTVTMQFIVPTRSPTVTRAPPPPEPKVEAEREPQPEPEPEPKPEPVKEEPPPLPQPKKAPVGQKLTVGING